MRTPTHTYDGAITARASPGVAYTRDALDRVVARGEGNTTTRTRYSGYTDVAAATYDDNSVFRSLKPVAYRARLGTTVNAGWGPPVSAWNRILLYADARPSVVTRSIVVSGLLAVWGSIGGIVAIAGGSWGVAALSGFTSLVSGGLAVIGAIALRSRWHRSSLEDQPSEPAHKRESGAP